jgi:hypothetical protein
MRRLSLGRRGSASAIFRLAFFPNSAMQKSRQVDVAPQHKLASNLSLSVMMGKGERAIVLELRTYAALLVVLAILLISAES